MLFAAAAAAWAQPANDNWSSATTIPSLPFNVVGEADMYLATSEPTDPDPPCRPIQANPASQSLWYSYTTGSSTEYVTLTMTNHSIVGIMAVYTGGPGAFRIVSGGCSSLSDDNNITRIAGLRLAANTTYSIEVAATFQVNHGNLLDFSVTPAAMYPVTKTADTNDGTCDSDCSLREAIAASNAVPGAVLIPAGTYKLTIADANEFLNEYNNATGSLDALHGMGIYGAGMQQTIIDANNLGRALDLDPVSSGTTRASFVIGDLTITHGHAVPTYTQSYGGGGVLLFSNSDYFGLERVAITSNQDDSESGGGLRLNSPGTIRDSIVSNNVATLYDGGGLSAGTSDNRFIEISGSTFSGNSATGSAGGRGGGIDAFATLRISNSTISGNHAIGNGGGINLYGSGSSLHMASSTVVLNTAQTNPSHSGGGGGGLTLDTDQADPNSIVDSIIAYNTTANSTDPQDCLVFTDNSLLTSSYNHVETIVGTTDFGIAPCQFAGLGDVTGNDPGVSHALANNGGLTPTHALLSGSPAQDSADPAGCKDAAGNALDYDQRGVGFPRVSNGRCDKGAFEFIDKIFADGFDLAQ